MTGYNNDCATNLAAPYHYDKFKCPPQCPECFRNNPDYKHLETYKADYITHRIQYHKVPASIVMADFYKIIAKESGCCDCNCGMQHYHCERNCCCKKDCCNCEDDLEKIEANKRKLQRLERALQDINHELGRIRSDIC